ncbi:uncharacterized protein LDX57_012678 [Aspergillus melleus]|uniref:uncharacterized protein n=1 Tax=Aspergillus melleus TaxID=138277 RepID=UPI001E8E671C|nr:uncharacterized protein LDX57_012678 [Aspergillus melleus]KAH8435049.1 hypothetical protein LDX57_012678 [Aspergillus melleus]
MPEKPFLQVIAAEHESCPVCHSPGSYPCALDHDWIKTLTTACELQISQSTDSQLLRLPGGFFWVALAHAARAEGVTAKEYPRRDRQAPHREGYLDSVAAIIGSSSPTGPSSSEYEIDLNDVDEDEHDDRRSKPEEVTAHLLVNYLYFALNLCLLQESDGPGEVRVRVERRKATVQVPGMYDFAAEDDGGISWMDRQVHGWRMGLPTLAFLEAKKAFKTIHIDERTGRAQPVVSNETLAQYLGEAIVAWRANQKLQKEDVFLIAGTNTFLRFVHFKFGVDYAEYMNATSETAQSILAANEDKDTFIYMHSTNWFNLQSPGDRKSALYHILALIKWQDSRNNLFSTMDDHGEDGDSSDESMCSE